MKYWQRRRIDLTQNINRLSCCSYFTLMTVMVVKYQLLKILLGNRVNFFVSPLFPPTPTQPIHPHNSTFVILKCLFNILLSLFARAGKRDRFYVSMLETTFENSHMKYKVEPFFNDTFSQDLCLCVYEWMGKELKIKRKKENVLCSWKCHAFSN